MDEIKVVSPDSETTRKTEQKLKGSIKVPGVAAVHAMHFEGGHNYIISARPENGSPGADLEIFVTTSKDFAELPQKHWIWRPLTLQGRVYALPEGSRIIVKIWTETLGQFMEGVKLRISGGFPRPYSL